MKSNHRKGIHRAKRVRTASDAVRFIDAAGYCLLFPIKNLPLPSLYFACARRNIHLGPGWDKYCERIWAWKDALPKQRRAFYAKYFKGRGTFVSLRLLPQFLAMQDAAAAPDDHARFYADGRISHDARVIWQALAEHGPLATLELRHTCKMDSPAGNVRFKRAMVELQRLLLVVHFGAEQETAAWASGRFQLTSRAFPTHVEQARRISAESARARIAAKYFESHPGATPAHLCRLFGWSKTKAISAHKATTGPG